MSQPIVPKTPIKLNNKAKYVLASLGILDLEIFEHLANNEKSKISKVTKDAMCQVFHKIVESLNKKASVQEKGIVLPFKFDTSAVPHKAQRIILKKIHEEGFSPNEASPAQSDIQFLTPPSGEKKSPPKSFLGSAVKNLAGKFEAVGRKSTAAAEPDTKKDEGAVAAEESVVTPTHVVLPPPPAQGNVEEVQEFSADISPMKLPPPPSPFRGGEELPLLKKTPICHHFKQRKCRHTNENGDMCKFSHPPDCKLFTLAGFTEKGCQNKDCDQVHPALCKKWLKGGWAGPCGNPDCKKIHPVVPRDIPSHSPKNGEASKPPSKKREERAPHAPPRFRKQQGVIAPWEKEQPMPWTGQVPGQASFLDQHLQAMKKSMMEEVKSMFLVQQQGIHHVPPLFNSAVPPPLRPVVPQPGHQHQFHQFPTNHQFQRQ